MLLPIHLLILALYGLAWWRGGRFLFIRVFIVACFSCFFFLLLFHRVSLLFCFSFAFLLSIFHSLRSLSRSCLALVIIAIIFLRPFSFSRGREGGSLIGESLMNLLHFREPSRTKEEPISHFGDHSPLSTSTFFFFLFYFHHRRATVHRLRRRRQRRLRSAQFLHCCEEASYNASCSTRYSVQRFS